MTKWIVLVAIIIAIYYFLIRKNSPLNRHRHAKKNNVEADIMLECKRCGTFTSSKEALIVDGQYFCSKECAEVQ